MIIFSLIISYIGYVNSISQDIPYYYNNYVYSHRSSYNMFNRQVGFCKMQSYDTMSRETSGGPSLYTSGAVLIGAGLSHSEFGEGVNNNWLNIGDGAVACGMCIEVYNITNIPKFENSLSNWNYNENTKTPFTVMVFDQCNDAVCTSGYLDFDVYSDSNELPVRYGNPTDLSWKAVDCPVYENNRIVHFIEFLFCTSNTCEIYNKDIEMFKEVINPYYFSVIIRNFKTPIISVELLDPSINQYIKLEYNDGIGWMWRGRYYDFTKDFNYKLTSFRNEILDILIPVNDILYSPSTIGYKGGLVYQTKSQFGQNKNVKDEL